MAQYSKSLTVFAFMIVAVWTLQAHAGETNPDETYLNNAFPIHFGMSTDDVQNLLEAETICIPCLFEKPYEIKTDADNPDSIKLPIEPYEIAMHEIKACPVELYPGSDWMNEALSIWFEQGKVHLINFKCFLEPDEFDIYLDCISQPGLLGAPSLSIPEAFIDHVHFPDKILKEETHYFWGDTENNLLLIVGYTDYQDDEYPGLFFYRVGFIGELSSH